MIDVVLLCDDLSLLVLVGLPCAYLDEWLVGIAEINHQEKISLVTIAVGVPVLLECYAIDVIVFWMLNDLDIIELHIDELCYLEHIA